jgi:hypothetical protein
VDNAVYSERPRAGSDADFNADRMRPEQSAGVSE